MTRLAAMAALLALLLQLGPATPGTTLLVVAAVLGLALARVQRGTVLGQLLVPLRARTVPRATTVTRQYEPAAAGRPQPRAPGCGR